MRRIVVLCALAAMAAGEDWKSLLADADPAVRLKAAHALAESGAADAIPELAECLIDESRLMRAAAARALGHAGAAAKRALPALERLLQDHNDAARIEALIAIARIGDRRTVADEVKRKPVVVTQLPDDVLLALLDDSSWHVRYWVLRMKRIQRTPPAAWEKRLAALAAEDPAGIVRLHALRALSRTPGAKPHMIGHLRNQDPRMRSVALSSLGQAVEVRALLADPVPQLRARAAYVLREDSASVPAIAKLLEDGEPIVRTTAAAVLRVWNGRTGPLLVTAAVRHGIPAPYPFERGERHLRAHGSFEGTVERLASTALLAAKENAAPYVIAAFRKAPNEELVHALGHAGAKDALRSALKDKDVGIQRRAAFCLVALGDQEFATLRVVIGCLADGEARVHDGVDWPETAVSTLVTLGKTVVPLLKARLRGITAVERDGDVETVTTTRESERIEAVLKRIAVR